MKPAITVDRLSKKYRLHRPEARYKSLRDEIGNFWKRERRSEEWFWAVRDVSFEIEAGTIVGILGRNGAGKSTLLKLLSRITRPTEGHAVVRGRLGSLLEVGSGFHPELSGRENVYMNGSIIGMRKAEIDRRFDEIVAFAEVEKFIDQPVKHYSSGMYMRLAFAVAAHLDTEILLIDEVLAVGDAAFQRKCLGKVGNVARDGRTVLFVSHNMTAVRSLCTQAICLEKGSLLDAGSAGEVVDRYLRTATAAEFSYAWPSFDQAPGDSTVRIKSFCLRGVEETITVASGFEMELEYWNLTGGETLNVSVTLHTLEDVCVLNSFSTPQSEPAGVVNTTCFFPPHLLNNGSYRLKAMIVRDGSVVKYQLPVELSFDVHDVERSVPWYGQWAGVVRPNLDWRTHCTDPAPPIESDEHELRLAGEGIRC